jgi:hypothetical protein
MLVTEPLALTAPRGNPSAHAPSTSQSAASSSSRRDFARASCAVQDNCALSSQGHGAASALLGRNARTDGQTRSSSMRSVRSSSFHARCCSTSSTSCNQCNAHGTSAACSVALLFLSNPTGGRCESVQLNVATCGWRGAIAAGAASDAPSAMKGLQCNAMQCSSVQCSAAHAPHANPSKLRQLRSGVHLRR